MKKKQKMILIICIIVGIVIIAAGTLYYFFFRGESQSNTNEIAYVDPVSAIAGLGSGTGEENRFSGVVESQETTEVKKNADKKIKEIFVSAGDEVTVGTPLFEYETEDTALTLEQERINLESIKNDISGYYSQIEELQKAKNKAPADEQLSYTTQIQTAQTNAKRAEYNKKAKEAEIEKLENDLANATVTSTLDGIVKEVNENTTYDNMGNPRPFMSIMASGEYRIKGKVNEQNVWSLAEGQPVLIRSRVDETLTWKGTISKVDTSSTYSDGDSSSGGVVVMGGGSSGENGQTSSSYSFYVTPESSSDFMLGQHVFIELDNGQEEPKEGLWLPSMYLLLDENDAYAWIANGKNRLEKRKITLGDYDSTLDEYEILDGITAEEYIAFPGNLLHEGMECVINDGTHTNSADDMGGTDMGGDMGTDMNSGEPGMDGGVLPADDGAVTDVQPVDDGSMDAGSDAAGDNGSMDAGSGAAGADGSMDAGSVDTGSDGNSGAETAAQ